MRRLIGLIRWSKRLSLLALGLTAAAFIASIWLRTYCHIDYGPRDSHAEVRHGVLWLTYVNRPAWFSAVRSPASPPAAAPVPPPAAAPSSPAPQFPFRVEPELASLYRVRPEGE